MKNKLYKRIKTGIVLLLALGSFSCESWLDVDPKSEIKADALFETETGFKDALIGAYLLMTSQDLYGLEMTVGFADALGQQYTIQESSNSYYYAARYQYKQSTVTNRISKIWSAAYNVIANLNKLLEQLEAKKDILHPSNYNMIKGEALGLRAFLHFDLMRMFGYGDLKNKPENLNKISIPYVVTYSKFTTPQSMTKDLLVKIHADLAEAEALLNETDPYGTADHGNDYELPNEDKFYDKRAKRFNYYAVKATQARVYLWEGDYTNAYKCADAVIDAGKFNWITDYNMASSPEKRDYTFSTEHVFGLTITNLYDGLKSWIVPGEINTNTNLLYHSKSFAESLFEEALRSDYRYLRLYKMDEKYTLLKFTYVEGSLFKDNMPLIRKSEMYYIAAECLNATGDANDRKEAIKLLNTVRNNRGISPQMNLEDNLTAGNVTDEIYKEYRKEFISEGQLFYFYKRLGYTTIPGTSIAGDDNVYKVPMPDVEIEFGSRE